jgi:hypothetical protein
MIAAKSDGPVPPLVRTHHQVWHGVQRVFDWYRPVLPVGPQPFPGDREWLQVVDHWKTGDDRPVWFLAALTRHDLALFDPRSRRLGGRFEMPATIRSIVGAETRLDGLNWWRLARPFWMLGAGWSLNPETAGMTRLDRLGPHVRPAPAFIRRSPSAVRVVVGGRYLEPGGATATVRASIDGRIVREWTVAPSSPWFVEWIDLPSGALDGIGGYATLDVQVLAAEPDRPAPWIGLEQFDAVPGEGLVYALTSGWHELEHDPATGREWRWTTARSVIEVRGRAGDVRLTIAGTSPLEDFDRAPAVVVRAGDREITRFRPADAFSESVVIPADALALAAGAIAIETDLTFVPGDRTGSPDRRRLGLRLTRVELVPVR